MDNLVIIAILLIILGGAAFYIYRAKKRGQTCIGCPHSKACGKKYCGIDKSKTQ